MTRHQSAFLDLTTPGGLVMARWQNRWQGEPVTFEGAAWRFVDFEWSGLSSGGVATSAPASLTLPLLPASYAVLQEASRQAWRGRLRVWQWGDADDGPAPPANQLLVASHRGLIALTQVGQNTMQATIDSALLAPDGGRFPPRIATTFLIGIPCVLGDS